MVRPGTSCPSRVPLRSMVRWSPSRAGRPTSASSAKLPRKPVDLGVDLLVGDRRARDLDPQALVAGQVQLGPHLDHGVEGQRTGFLAGRDVDLGRGDGVDVVIPQAPGSSSRAGRRGGLRTAPSPCPTGPRGCAGVPCRAKARDADLPGDLAEGGVDGLLELLLIDLDRQLDLVALEGLDHGFHSDPDFIEATESRDVWARGGRFGTPRWVATGRADRRGRPCHAAGGRSGLTRSGRRPVHGAPSRYIHHGASCHPGWPWPGGVPLVHGQVTVLPAEVCRPNRPPGAADPPGRRSKAAIHRAEVAYSGQGYGGYETTLLPGSEPLSGCAGATRRGGLSAEKAPHPASAGPQRGRRARSTSLSHPGSSAVW